VGIVRECTTVITDSASPYHKASLPFLEKNRMKKVLAFAACLIVASASQAIAAPIVVDMVGGNGTLPGTSITYTVSSNVPATVVFPGSSGSSTNGVFQWVTPFNEYVGTNAISTTITFSQAIPVSRIVAGVDSIIESGTGFNLSLSGGTATTNDFTLSDGLNTHVPGGPAMYDPATGNFSSNTPGGDDQSVMIGSTSSATVTSLTLVGNDNGDGWATFFGVTTAAAVPEPSSFVLAAIGAVGMIAGSGRLRRKV
jgi:PEP-CTERM motif